MGVSPHTVLIVDDDAQVRAMICAVLEDSGGVKVVGEASDGHHAVQLAASLKPDVVLMDVEMPNLDGAHATEQIIRANPSTRVVAHTGHLEVESVTRMIVAGALGYSIKGRGPDDLVTAINDAASSKTRVDPEVLPQLFQSVVSLAREERTRRREAEMLHRELKANIEETIRALAAALASRDQSTGDHDNRVALLAIEVGKRMGFTGKALADLEYGAIFHDLGKLAMPDSILRGNRPELTAEEWAVIHTHTIVGEQIIAPISFLRSAAKIVRYSHEHWDGGGYPDGLAGTDIPLASRVILACDAYDAMVSGRTYQKAMSHEAAVARLRELTGTHFDPQVVGVLLEHVAENVHSV